MARGAKIGRPTIAQVVASAMVKIRVTPEVLRAWEARAAAAEQTLSEWIRERCNQ